MEILNIAIQAEGSVSKLATALDVRQNVVSNWKKRRVPKAWEQLLEIKYAPKGKKKPVKPTAEV